MMLGTNMMVITKSRHFKALFESLEGKDFGRMRLERKIEKPSKFFECFSSE